MLFKENLDADLDWSAKLHIIKGIAEFCKPLKLFLKAYTCALWAATVFLNPKCLYTFECPSLLFPWTMSKGVYLCAPVMYM